MADSTSPVQVLTVKTGYHGTSHTNAVKARTEGALTPSSDGFLGRGIYFYVGHFADKAGREWAEKRYREGAYKRPLALMKAQIEPGRCLDYTSAEFVEELPKLIAGLRKRGKTPFSDADVVELFASRADVDTVCALHETTKLFAGSHYGLPLYHYCVRNSSKILSLSLATSWA